MPTALRRHAGFTLLEILVALSILAFMATVAVPALSRRLDVAFEQADLAQAQASARMLPLRCALMGAPCVLNPSDPMRRLPDGSPPLDLPPGWRAQLLPPSDQQGLHIGRGGSCSGGRLMLHDAQDRPRAQLAFEPLSCTVTARAPDGLPLLP